MKQTCRPGEVHCILLRREDCFGLESIGDAANPINIRFRVPVVIGKPQPSHSSDGKVEKGTAKRTRIAQPAKRYNSLPGERTRTQYFLRTHVPPFGWNNR